jgi:adenylate cyclase
MNVAEAGSAGHCGGVSSLQPIKKLRATLWLYLSLVALSLCWLLLSQWGLLRPLEQLSLDARFKVRGPIEAPVRVVYVDIDTDSLLALGNFPWDRGLFAQVSDGLIRQGGAKAVGIDVVFSEGGVPNVADPAKVVRGQTEFGRFLAGRPPVVLAASYSEQGIRMLDDGTKVDQQIPLVEGPGGRVSPPELPRWEMDGALFYPPLVGLIDIMDGHTSEAPMFARIPERTFHHLSLELSRLYYGLRVEDVRIEPDHIDLKTEAGELVRRIPLEKQQMVSINWFSRWTDDERNPRASFATVLTALQWLKSADPAERAEAKAFFADDYFKDAVVLIGPVANMLQDLAPTSFDRVPVPKVGVHGNLVKTIISGRFLRHPPEWALFAITIGLTGLIVGLSVAEGGRSTLRRVIAALLFVGYVALCFVAFSWGDWVLPMVVPLGAAFTSAFIGGAAQLVLAQKQKSRIKGLFGAYLAPSIVSQMVDAGQEPKLGGVEEQITAYFSDIESFSTFSERLSATQLVELMNEYLTACTDIVQAEGGTLDKYIGDAVVAIYGAPLVLPNHPLQACLAALRVQRRCAELREKWSRETEKNWPDVVLRLRTRIGLNTGRAVVGNMGSASRFSYTMMGDTVNLAARMESGAKAWGVYTMCADPTREACEAADAERRVVFRALGRIVVKGRVAPVPIHEMVGLKEDVADRTREAISRFEAGLAKYYEQDWDAALGHFRASAALEPNQPDPATGIKTNPSLIYQHLVAELREQPPGKGWDGAYVMREK